MKAEAAAIPSLDRLLNQPALGELLAHHGRTQVKSALRAHLNDLRREALSGSLNPASLGDDHVAAVLEQKLGAAATWSSPREAGLREPDSASRRRSLRWARKADFTWVRPWWASKSPNAG